MFGGCPRPSGEAPAADNAMIDEGMGEAPPTEEPMMKDETIEESTNINEDGSAEEDEVTEEEDQPHQGRPVLRKRASAAVGAL